MAAIGAGRRELDCSSAHRDAALLRTTCVAFVPVLWSRWPSLRAHPALRREPPTPLLDLLLQACDLRESDDQDP